MNIGVVGNPRYADLQAILRLLADLAPKRGITLFTDEGLEQLWPKVPAPIERAKLDVLVTLGGDGTLLRGARLLAGKETPILGVNLGRVGFLTSASRESFAQAIEALAAGRHAIERRQVLEAKIRGADGSERSLTHALNDVVVHKGGVARVVRLRVTIGKEEVGPYSADGIVVATPTGSTAYSLSAGGPIVVPGVEALVVTPICAHTLAVRPLVIPGTSELTIEPIAPWADDLLVSFDGQVGTTLVTGDKVHIRRADHKVLLVRLEGDSFFELMREKLHWGDLQHRLNAK
ncbi:MAG: NAD(+)/NADH kinase [Gemmatimonadetes bacterium]|nr:NAD(+)/NADH kinase [Gemmatimonadota bacterium]